MSAAHARIEIDPAVMGGKPVIRGARVTAEQVLRDSACGATATEIADQYPRVAAEDVAAALAFADPGANVQLYDPLGSGFRLRRPRNDGA